MGNPLPAGRVGGQAEGPALAAFRQVAHGQRLSQPGYLGFVHVAAFVILSICSIAGVELAVRTLPKIPDKVHAYVYVGLLVLVLVMMLL